MSALILLVCGGIAAQPTCRELHTGIELGSGPIQDPQSINITSASGCCSLCLARPRCRAWTFSNKSKHGEPAAITCALNTHLGKSKSKSWATSGVVRGSPHPSPPPAPPPPTPPPPGSALSATVSFESSAPIFIVEPHFVSYTIDTSDERGFFQRDLTNPRLRWLAQQLSPAVLRVGGSGGDELYYDVPHMSSNTCPGQPFPKCKASKPPASGGLIGRAGVAYCLNTTMWDALNQFAAAADAKLVFGLNFFLNTSSHTVTSLLQYTAQRKYSIYGYEYG